MAPLARLAQVGGVSLQLAAARPGDTVGVIGLGPVGNLVAQLAQVSGYGVVGVERSASRRALAQACGLKRVVPPEEARDALGTGRGQARPGVLRKRGGGCAGHRDLRPSR